MTATALLGAMREVGLEKFDSVCLRDGVMEESKVVIEITPAMIKAGVDALSGFHFGEKEGAIVADIYLTMEIERLESIKERTLQVSGK